MPPDGKINGFFHYRFKGAINENQKLTIRINTTVNSELLSFILDYISLISLKKNVLDIKTLKTE